MKIRLNLLPQRIGYRQLVAGAVLLATAAPLHAEELVLRSSLQGWKLTLDTPSLAVIEQRSSSRLYRYFAKSEDGVFLSLHVSPMQNNGVGHKACVKRFWHSDATIPTSVDLDSLEFRSHENFEQVRYDFILNHKGRSWDMPNSHLYFEVNGHCADLHIGATPTYEHFRRLVESIKMSLRAEALPPTLSAQLR